MNSTATQLTDPLAAWSAVVAALSALPSHVVQLRALDEATFLVVNELQSQASRILGASGALVAGEVAHRSRPALGMKGLAQRKGFRTPERMLTQTTGVTKQQAITALSAGKLLAEFADDGSVDEVTGEVLAPSKPWLLSVGRAVEAGRLSTSAAQAIGSGLGVPNSAVTAAQLALACSRLVAEAIAGVDADRLWKRAREARDELDVAGVRVREDEAVALRSLTHFELPDGGGMAIWRMDPETYAQFKDVYDRSTSPKLGGVRFVSPEQAERAASIAADGRTPVQLASDAFVQLLRLGADANPLFLLGSGAAIIRITVAEDALETGVGLGTLEGQSGAGSVDSVSIDTVQRLLCGGDSIRMGFDPAGNVLNVESEQRLFSKRQREVLAVKFGGCMDPNCERPPSWTEAHHILQWVRDRGKTLIENGILLCRWHHLMYHNEGYEIERDAFGNYWQIPPVSVDPLQVRVAMPLKSNAITTLWRDKRAG
jgi:hypothetical protein